MEFQLVCCPDRWGHLGSSSPACIMVCRICPSFIYGMHSSSDCTASNDGKWPGEDAEGSNGGPTSETIPATAWWDWRKPPTFQTGYSNWAPPEYKSEALWHQPRWSVHVLLFTSKMFVCLITSPHQQVSARDHISVTWIHFPHHHLIPCPSLTSACTCTHTPTKLAVTTTGYCILYKQALQ